MKLQAVLRGLTIKFAVKVLHPSLLNTTVVAFKVLPLGSYATMPAPSPPFKTILEMVLWNGLQNCRCITPDVIKIPSFQYFLYLREEKKSHWGLDPVNRQGVSTVICLVAKKSLTESAEWEGALSWCKIHELLAKRSGRFRLNFSRSVYSTSK